MGKFAELLKLTPMLHRLPNELSGGQQQRTALARALVKGADLVLLDEPLANLDYKLREELRDELPKMFADTGATVVYATSEPLEALLLGGYTATLNEGRVVQFGKTSTIYRHPETLESARVFSDPPVNVAAIEKRGDTAYLSDLISWSVPEKLAAMPDGQYKIGLRPHHLSPDGEGIEVSGEVQIAEISGSESIIHVDLIGNSWVSESQGVHPFVIGNSTDLHLQVNRCLYFGDDGGLVAS